MKLCIKSQCFLPALIVGLCLILTDRLTAQTFTTLHSFTNSGGSNPQAGLTLSGNTLYGMAKGNISSNGGAVFKINTDGTGFTNLHSFNLSTEGGYSEAGLILAGNALYGITQNGGSGGAGALFTVNTNGTGFTTLHSFTGGSDGGFSKAGLILSDPFLYGTTSTGGSSGNNGTVFAVHTNGTGFTNLHSFTGGIDGGNPQAGLILSDNTLYGTTRGTVFAINTDGTGFNTLYSFNNEDGSDGYDPSAGLILSGNTLYGTASQGGSSGRGTVFAVQTNGANFFLLHSFTALDTETLTNSDGANPYAGLILSGNALYGTASKGGSSGYGTVFAVKTDGSNFTTLYNFTAISGSSSTNSDGANPYGSLIFSGNTLYGPAYYGGGSGRGTVFSLSLPPPPQLKIILYGADIILTWPTNSAGFTLQSTMNLVSPAVWITNSPEPIVIGGQNVVINSVSGTQRFFRLSQ